MIRSFKNAAWGGKRRRIASVFTVALLLMSGTALAAWVLLSGTSGSGGAKVGTYEVQPSVMLTPVYDASSAATPGNPGRVKANLQNMKASPVQITGLTVAPAGITSDTPSCDVSGITFTFGGAITLSANELRNNADLGALTVPANGFDTDCANSSLTVPLTGITNP